MRSDLQNNLKQSLWRAVALVTILALSLPPAPAMAHQSLDCAAGTHANLQGGHAGHRAEAEAGACAADAAIPDHDGECCGDQCDGCVCTVCPATFVIFDSKGTVIASVADAGATPVATAFDNFSVDVPRAPPKPRS